jgi:predicted aspartyl protease
MNEPVSSSNFPYLPIHVRIRQPNPATEQELDLEALVDTGFDGGLVIPKNLVDPSLVPTRHLPWSLADDSEVLAPAFLGYVQVGGLPPVPTVVIPLGDEPLLGRHVTNNFRLIFDHGHEITVEL